MKITLTISGQLSSLTGPSFQTDLRAEPFRVGRDGDWKIRDPENKVSRHHLEFCLRDGQVFAKDVSSRGSALGNPDNRMATGEDVLIADDVTFFVPNGQIKVSLEKPTADAEDFFGFALRHGTHLSSKNRFASPVDTVAGRGSHAA